MEYIEYISEYASEYASNLKNYISSLFYKDDENLGIDIGYSNDIISYSTYNYRQKYKSSPCKKRFIFKKDIECELRNKKFDEEYLELENRFNKLKEEIEHNDDDDKNYPDDALSCKVKTKKLLFI